MYFVIIMAQLKSGASRLWVQCADHSWILPPYICWGSFFYSHNLLFDESRIFSEEFVCVWLYIGIPAGLLPYIAYTGTCMCHWAGYICFLTSLSWKGYIILCVSVNRILPRWILVYKTNDCNANFLYSNCQ